MRFTLESRKWYSAEIIGEEFSNSIRSYTPIKVHAVKQESKGDRVFHLEFYHANYPDGVKDKTYKLQTIERNSEFILALSLGQSPKRFLLIYPMSKEWLVDKFGVNIEPGQSAEEWLEQNA